MESEDKFGKKWDTVGIELANWFPMTCGCQRKLKSIVDGLKSLKDRVDSRNYDFTGTELLLIDILDGYGYICHGTNIEYPMLCNKDFWDWVEDVSKYDWLEDN